MNPAPPRRRAAPFGVLLIIAAAACGDGGKDASKQVASVAGTYVGEFMGSEAGPAGCTLGADGKIEAWADSPSTGRFHGTGHVAADGAAQFSVSGGGAAAGYAVVFEGRFAVNAGKRSGNGTWKSSSGFIGTWHLDGSGDGLATGPPLNATNICVEMATRYCRQNQPCCQRTEWGFDPGKCEASFMRFCSDGLEALQAGKVTLHGEKLYECVARAQPFIDRCFLETPSERAGLIAAFAPCLQIFRGVVPPGGACTTFIECQPGLQTELTSCRDGTCARELKLTMDAACDPSAPTCTDGLMCDFGSRTCVGDSQRRPALVREECTGF
jgi:hypothetical protein